MASWSVLKPFVRAKLDPAYTAKIDIADIAETIKYLTEVKNTKSPNKEDLTLCMFCMLM